MGLLNVPAEVSRVHASRRVFQHLSDTKNDLAIIHHASFPGASEVRRVQKNKPCSAPVRVVEHFLAVRLDHVHVRVWGR